MADPYLGEIEVFAFGFAPKGWAFCAGQTMSIPQNQALFSLLGTTYGGDGIRTFNLPDLRGRLAMGQGTGAGLSPRSIGDTGGEESHTLLLTETPPHSHTLDVVATNTVTTNTNTPGGTVVLAKTTGKASGGAALAITIYVTDPNANQVMAAAAIGSTGGQPHGNQMPYLALNFCIALQGSFPTRP